MNLNYLAHNLEVTEFASRISVIKDARELRFVMMGRHSHYDIVRHALSRGFGNSSLVGKSTVIEGKNLRIVFEPRLLSTKVTISDVDPEPGNLSADRRVRLFDLFTHLELERRNK